MLGLGTNLHDCVVQFNLVHLLGEYVHVDRFASTCRGRVTDGYISWQKTIRLQTTQEQLKWWVNWEIYFVLHKHDHVFSA